MIVLDAPSNLGLRAACARGSSRVRGGSAMRCGRAGWSSGSARRDAGRVEAPPWVELFANRARDPGLHGGAWPRGWATCCGAGEKPLVLGGDCSILLGAMLALRRRGRYGLAFVDGHLDFRVEDVDAVAGEDLAVVTGRAEDALADIDGLRPYVRDEDVVALGEREGDTIPSSIRVIDLDALRARRVGACRACRTGCTWTPTCCASTRSTRPRRAGSRSTSWRTLLRRLRRGAVGVQVTIFDPDKDPDGSAARALTDCLVSALAP